jgi:uncharacterized protein Yka (UPF0111/DUF47 family)
MIRVKIKDSSKILDEEEEVIVPNDEELYRKAKLIKRLNAEIDKLRKELTLLLRKRGELKCDEPSLDDILNTCNAIARTQKGTLHKKNKK